MGSTGWNVFHIILDADIKIALSPQLDLSWHLLIFIIFDVILFISRIIYHIW